MALFLWGVLISAAIWMCLYYGIKHRYSLEPEWCCRLLTTAHAVLVTCLSILSSYSVGTSFFDELGAPNTILQNFILATSIGYFIFDLTWCLYYQTEGGTMLCHHVVSIVAMTRILMKGVSAIEAVAGLGGLEITNPLLQLRWFLRSWGFKDTFVYTFVEVCFMSLFFIMRMIGGSYLYFSILRHSRPDFETKLLASSLYAISWIFMIYIFKYFIAKYLTGAKKIKEA